MAMVPGRNTTGSAAVFGLAILTLQKKAWANIKANLHDGRMAGADSAFFRPRSYTIRFQA